MCQVIDEMLVRSDVLDNELFYKAKSKKILVNELESIIKEVL